MKLSELVHFKNQLDKLSARPARDESLMVLKNVTYIVNRESITESQDNVKCAFDLFEKELNKVKEDIKTQIEVAEKPWFQNSYTLYEGEIHNTVQADSILATRKRPVANLELFQTRLSRYADWRYPAMIIRPGLEDFITDLVAFDPLYVVDLNMDYLNPAISKFNETYQNRLRPYTVKEDLDKEILARIPDNQFGLCFAYQYFDFRPFEVLKKYFSEVYEKLKPGGTFILTFNDCDRASAVELVEKYFCSYTPGYLVRELAVSMGYEIEFSWNDPGPTTWLELRKPGSLETLKGGQSIAKILPKPL